MQHRSITESTLVDYSWVALFALILFYLLYGVAKLVEEKSFGLQLC